MVPPDGDPPPGAAIQPVVQIPSPIVVQVVTPEKAPSRKSRWQSLWDKLIQLLPFLQAVVIALLTYRLTGQVTNAIQQRQLELNNVKEMQSLLGRLYEKQAPGDLAATISALTTFRDYAVLPLTHLLQSTEPNQRTAGESGLRTLALGDSAAVAEQLVKIVNSRNRVCGWRMRLSAVKLLGNLDCRESLHELRALRTWIGDANQARATEALANISDPDTPPDSSNTADLRAELDKAIARLEHQDAERMGR